MTAEALPRILVVEDDPLLSDLLAQKLSKHFDLVHAPTGEAALAECGKHKPDLMILDILLPGIDGFEVLRRIKAEPATADVRVVVLSNLGSQEDIEKGTKLGAEKFIVKVSLSLEEVLTMVRTMLGQKTDA